MKDETWGRDQFKGGFKICISVFVHLKLSKSSLQFVLHVVSNLLQEMPNVSHIFGKTLNLCVCVCLCFVLSLLLSHLLIIETHFHFNINLSHHQSEKILDIESSNFFDNISWMGYLPTPRKVAFSKAPVSVKSQRCCVTCLFVRFEFSKCIQFCWKAY